MRQSMSYWLEKRIVLRRGETSQITWRRYAVCGSRPLLERVRAGQKQPESWRIVPEAFIERENGREMAG